MVKRLNSAREARSCLLTGVDSKWTEEGDKNLVSDYQNVDISVWTDPKVMSGSICLPYCRLIRSHGYIERIARIRPQTDLNSCTHGWMVESVTLCENGEGIR